MEFWRIYRLVFARRWLLLAMMAVAAAVVFVGTTLKAGQKQFTAEALLQPQDTAPSVFAGAPPGGDTASAAAADRVNRISDLIMLLRSSNDLYVQAAGLLRRTEAERATEVQRILTRNGYFASIDKEIEAQAKEAVGRDAVTEDAAPKLIKENKARSRQIVVDALAKVHDELGGFAQVGIGLPEGDIVQTIRENMTFETVAGPMSNDNSPQIVNQIKITATGKRKAEAELYANMVCVAFLNYFPQISANKRNAQIEQLTELRHTAKQVLDKATTAELNYRAKHQAVLTATPEDSVSRLSALRSQKGLAATEQEAARAAVVVAERELAAAKPSITTPLPTEENPEVRRAQAQVETALINFNAINASNVGEESDAYKSAKAALDSARNNLEEARRRPYTQTVLNNNQASLQLRVADTRGQFTSAKQRVEELNRQISAQEALVQTLPAISRRLGELGDARQRADKNYSDIDARLKQADLSAATDSQAGLINIVSQAHATPVGADIAAQRPRLIVYGAILALLFGVGMVVGLDALDNTMRGANDVEKLLGLPVVGIIPAQLPDSTRTPRITQLEPRSPEAEAYRILRTELLFTNVQQPFQSLMTVTGKPGQGATTTISNLAIALAQSGKRVILVDADLRYPKLHNAYKKPNHVGLTTILSGETTLDEALQTTEVENLRLLSAGRVVVNPSELLGSWEMHTLHEELKQRADFVLFDAPSAIAFSDAAVLASFIDRVLMVVRASNVPRGSEERILGLLNKAGANIIGVVLNDVPSEKVDSVHYHRNYYPTLLPGSTNSAYDPYTNGSGSGSGPGRPPQMAALPLASAGTASNSPRDVVNGTALSLPEEVDRTQDIERTQEMFVLPTQPPVVSPAATPIYVPVTSEPVNKAIPPSVSLPWKTYLLGAGVAVLVGGLVLALVASVGVK